MQQLHKVICFIAVTILALFNHNILASAQKAPTHNELEQLDRKIKQIAQKHNIASVSYAIIQQQESMHMASIGFTNIESQTKATANGKYRLASISKMIVGIAIMQLVESNQVKLSDKVKNLLPELSYRNRWSSTHPLRLLHLVENTTGWNEISLQEFAYNNEPQLPLAESLALYPDSRVSRWPPGTRHAYTNSTAAVAALLVERITGMSFASYTQQYIFSPLDISSASYTNQPSGIAMSYGSEQELLKYKPILLTPAGGLSMNLVDITKLLNALINRSPLLLKHKTYQRIEHSHSTNAGVFPAGYGVFNAARYYQNWRFRGHDGAFRGWRSEFSYSPQFKAGFIVLQNSENDAGFKAINMAISKFLTTRFGKKEMAYAKEATQEHHLAGYYRYQNPRIAKRYFIERITASFKLAKNSDGYRFSSMLPSGWQRDLYYAGDNKWQNDKGEVVMIQTTDPLLGNVIHYGDRVFTPISTFNAWVDKVLLVVWLLALMLAIPLGIFWLVRFSKQKYQHSASKKVRQAILLAALSAWLFILLFALGMMSPIDRLGSTTWIAIGLMLSSYVLAVVTSFSCWYYVKNINQSVGKFAITFGAIYLSTQAIVVLYFTWFGVIGIQSWN